mmetsp:Transcript_24236/g.35523  ORF Transcript_24236/g.35523 Transcript_24236/m.35523 type:complete len:334 (+) Transcript_24236:542-1543(+)
MPAAAETLSMTVENSWPAGCKNWACDLAVTIVECNWRGFVPLLVILGAVLVIVFSGTALPSNRPKHETTSGGSFDSAEDIRVGELEKQIVLLKESAQKTTDDLHKTDTQVENFKKQVVLLQESVQRKTDDLQIVDVRVKHFEEQILMLEESVQKKTDNLQKADTRIENFEEQVLLLKKSVEKKSFNLQKADIQVENFEEQVLLLKKSLQEKEVELKTREAQMKTCKKDCSTDSSCLTWKIIGSTQPSGGQELINAKLARNLLNASRKEFTKEEWDAFGISDLGMNDYIKSGDSYFKLAAGEGLVEIMYLVTGAVGTVITTTFGYGLYWFATQG